MIVTSAGSSWALAGWRGDTIRVPLQAPVALGNRGGLISLLGPDGLKVDEAAYTKPKPTAKDGASSSETAHRSRRLGSR